jgi:alpha-1,3-rhamnosyl/mannosyltransferase
VAAVLREFGLPTEYLLYVGTAKPHKNLATLACAQRALDVPLVCAGPTPAELAAAGVDPSVVRALGRVPDRALPPLYSGARLLAQPSLVEGCGLTPLEAMACGTPVVVSDGGALPDTVGDSGVVVPARDVEAWTDALRRVNEDETLRDELRKRGLAHVATRDWRTCARRYVAVYRDAAEMR